MENIRQALERAKTLQESRPQPRDDSRLARQNPATSRGGYESRLQHVELNPKFLQERRIVSYNGADPRARPFDMLRTQVLQAMDLKGWKVLAITSPIPSCGKTLTALNLALSIARQPERSVLLVDLDLQKPQVAACLGLPAAVGVLGILEEQTNVQEQIIHARIGNARVSVLPTLATKESSELMASRRMSALIQDIRRDFQSHVIILDLPPILSSDDVIALLPQIDCALLVAAVGVCSVSEIEECNRHLQSTDVVRVVLNKVENVRAHYYY